MYNSFVETSSQLMMDMVNGSHRFEIKGYSLLKGMGIGKYVASESFIVGGHQWAIYFYPDGKDLEDNFTYISAYLALVSEGTNVRAQFKLLLLDLSGEGKHFEGVENHYGLLPENGPHTFKNCGSIRGYRRFYIRRQIETSSYLKDDWLKIDCTIGVLVSSIDSSKLETINVPESNMGAHFGMLLEDEELSDVIFYVGGERFHAHKLVLAARSTVFETQLFNGMEKDVREIVVTNMEPKVFKALLHFIYRDTLVEDEEFSLSYSSSFLPSIFESFSAKLLDAAEKYGLLRLKLMCESVICKDVSINSVAYILTLADQYHANELKSICLNFSAENLNAVMRSDGFKYLKENYPLLQIELLNTMSGCENKFNGEGTK